MAGMTALPLQDFIANLDNSCLPKIIQVCSGVYFQGSIYEISGNEVSFSTGDLLKVIGIELLSVSCEDVHNKEKFELPINHTGLFKVLPEEMPYSTIEEMLSLRPISLESSLPFTFTSSYKMTFGNLTVGAGKALTVLSIERHEGQEDQVRCRLEGQQNASAEVCIPISSRGEFYECEGEEHFTLQEILSSPSLQSRKFCFVNTAKCERTLVFRPIYQVNAIMSLRKNVLKFPSSLEVDVVELCQDVEFISPLSLTEVLSQSDESFPAVVEILEKPDSNSLLKCGWVSHLTKHEHLIFHKKGTLPMVLVSTSKGRKVQQYFMVSQQYSGRFRRRPREFNSVYQLYVASMQAPGLKVSVTRNCEEDEEEGLPALSVGEQLEIVRCHRMELPRADNKGQKPSVEALLCQRLQEPDDEEDDDDDDDGDDGDKEEVRQEEKKEVLLPLYMQSHFVEVLCDKKKYKLRDLGKKFSLPLDVKVVSRDTELETDPLAGFPCLRIEAAMLEPMIQASFPISPEYCFEIPTQWLSMLVHFTQKPLPWPQGEAPQCSVERVTEVTDAFFYEFCKQGYSAEAPPPRPPKQNLSSSEPSKKVTSKTSKKKSKAEKEKFKQGKSIPAKQFSELTLNHKKRPPAPPSAANTEDEPPPITPRKHQAEKTIAHKALPNAYVKMKDAKKQVLQCDVSTDEDEHDYETVEDTLKDMLKSANEQLPFY